MKKKTDIVPAAPAPIVAPKLKTGDDAEVAKRFAELFHEAQNGIRTIVAFGLYAEQVKLTKLKKSQFGNWVKGTFKDISYRSVRAHMQLASSALEACGYKSLKAFFRMAAVLPFANTGDMLLLPEKGLSPAAVEIRTKICALIDGKSARQLFTEFKQADEDEENDNPKRGRMKGKGGASAAQRAKAQAAKEAGEIAAMECWVEEAEEVIIENVDDLHWGRMSDGKAEQLLKLFETGVDYLKGLVKRRKSAKGGAQ